MGGDLVTVGNMGLERIERPVSFGVQF